jgi:hypothetical protein
MQGQLNLSVIIPNYNRETLVAETISNLLAHESLLWTMVPGRSYKLAEIQQFCGISLNIL